MLLCWTDDAWADYLYWQSQDRKTLKRVNTLIRDMQRTPFEGIGKPNPSNGACPAHGRGASTQPTVSSIPSPTTGSASSPRRTTTE